jgi:hypothetical protein
MGNERQLFASYSTYILSLGKRNLEVLACSFNAPDRCPGPSVAVAEVDDGSQEEITTENDHRTISFCFPTVSITLARSQTVFGMDWTIVACDSFGSLAVASKYLQKKNFFWTRILQAIKSNCFEDIA